jgi:hypothetical protein
MSNHSITIERLTNWKLVKELAYATVSKDADTSPSGEWKRKMLKCEHSPIRAMIYKIKLTNIPYYVSVHLSRHKFGVEHYVSTQRTDRTGEDRNGKRQDAPVNHTMIVNAAALIFMSRKRLCNLADETTQRIWTGVKHMMACIGEHEMADAMRPECVYRNGICPEMKPCGMRKGVMT